MNRRDDRRKKKEGAQGGGGAKGMAGKQGKRERRGAEGLSPIVLASARIATKRMAVMAIVLCVPIKVSY